MAALLVNLAIGIDRDPVGAHRGAHRAVDVGAVTLYALSMVPLFALRRREPELPRPVRAVAYPLFPAIALALSVLSLASIAVTNWGVMIAFGAILLVSVGAWRFSARARVVSPDGSPR